MDLIRVWCVVGATLLLAGTAAAAPAKVDPKDLKTSESGLKYAVLKAGKGPGAVKNQLATIHYTGWLENGKEFDSSRERDRPLQFTIGRGQLIPGMDEGVLGMTAGEQRQLILPPKLAYGAEGTPDGTIPPNSTLIFEVELVKLGEIMEPNDKPTKVDPKEIKTNPSGLQYAVIKAGTGDTAKKGQTAVVHYTGWLQSNGQKFDSSVDRGQPFAFPLGGGRVIKGWDEGVQGMKVGEKRQLIIPAKLAYGERGVGPIPANAILVFDVQLLELRD
jgi:FKBP-type peptidyl-prolyl cis-trans isomerase